MPIGNVLGIGYASNPPVTVIKKALSMNGSGDYLKTPSLTFNKVVVDAIWNQKTGAYQNYWSDSSLSNALQRTSANVDHIVGATGTVLLNGSAKIDNTAYISTGTRCTLEIDYASPLSSALVFCANGSGGSLFMKATIFSIKIYNSAALVAYYDMSTGTVADQSGNNKYGTLTGGTWITL